MAVSLGFEAESARLTSMSKVSLSRNRRRSGSPTSIGWATILFNAVCRPTRRFSIKSELKRPVARKQCVPRQLFCRKVHLNAAGSERTDHMLFRHTGHDDARVVLRERFIQPDKVAVPPQDRKVGFAVRRRGRLPSSEQSVHTSGRGGSGFENVPSCERYIPCAALRGCSRSFEDHRR